MDFLPTDLIRKKRFGGTHTRTEIRSLIQAFTKGELPDYQMAAWLMAVCFQGMNGEETAWLTEEMRDSGTVLDLSDLGSPVDKHSTGGIGDKTSLILAPLVAAAGIPVPMMAGRGLGHTGGTLDKLESISGFQVNLDLKRFQQLVREIGACIIGQTKDICPADRKLYALRDVTGTIDSLPLICGSILSKKLAEGIQSLVLDVKFGSGAFMKTLKDAEALGQALCDLARRSGKNVRALLTRMDEPLGRFVGNSLEVQECVEIMEGKTGPATGKDYGDTIALTLELAAHMIVLGGRANDLEQARALATQLLRSGAAKEKFERMCEAQGGKLSKGLPKAQHQEHILATQSGCVLYTDIEKVGVAAIHLGAGRRYQDDKLDLSAGIEVWRKQGEKVKAGDVIFTLHHNRPEQIKNATTTLQQSFLIGDAPTTPTPLIAKVIQ